MSVKSQLNASRDFILTGMRAAARVQTQNPNATKILRGCLDLIETLERQPAENLTITDLETSGTSAFVSSIQNAAGRLMELRRELAAAK
jgi:hypothetical protein